MTKQELQQYTHLRRERDQIARLLEALECKMQDPRAAQLDALPRGGTPDGSATERMVEQHDELLRRYRSKLDELDAAQLAIETAVAALPHREATLIRMHYIEGMTWEQVAVALAYTWRHVHRIHSDALQLLQAQT